MRVVERHFFGKRVSPKVTQTFAQIAARLADVSQLVSISDPDPVNASGSRE
jgi:hypothetical protein